MGRSINSVEGLDPPFDLVDERIVRIPAGHLLRNTRTRAAKLVICLEGRFIQSIDGGPPFPYCAGDAAYFTGPCVQEITPVGKRSAATLTALRILFVPRRQEDGGQPGQSDLTALLSQQLPSHTCVQGFVDPEVSSLLRIVRSETEALRPGYRQVVSACLTRVVVAFMRRARHGLAEPVEAVPASSRAEQITARAKAFIEDNFRRRPSLGEIAWDQNLSAEHLARVFRATTGRTVGQYLDEVRIEQAKNLLSSSDLTVGSIARKCGFSNATQFGFRFKKITGFTPSAYRGRQAFGELRERSTWLRAPDF